MSGSRSLLIRADGAVTLDEAASSVVSNAAVLVEGDTIRAVGPADEIEAPGADLINLPGMTLLPGLINAHCHLDYTGLRGALPARAPFTSWILSIIAAKRRMRVGDYEASVRAGLDEALCYGTTTVFDVSCDSGRYAVVRVAAETPVRVAFFGEVLGLNPLTAGWRMRRLRRAFEMAAGEPFIARGISPHAVYSLSQRLLKLVGRELERQPMPMAVHVLESRDEPRLRPWCDPRDAVRILDRRGLLGKTALAVHVNTPSDEDVALLAKRGASVVHCPGSHRFFNHDPFPAERLREAGVPICLGTDSLASNERLDMFREMCLFLDAHPAFSAGEALRMATTAPARFLGLDGRLGVLKAGALADMIAVPAGAAALRPCSVDEACANVVRHEGEAPWVMIGGRIVRHR
jgi:cytosine/adenosine deaminase-related metal-dependent hydrolase